MEQTAEEIDKACKKSIESGDIDTADKLYKLLDRYCQCVSDADELIEKAEQKKEDEFIEFLKVSEELEDVWNEFDVDDHEQES